MGLRVDWAAEEPWSKDRPLAELALAAGLSDQSHSGRDFKHRSRIPPGEKGR